METKQLHIIDDRTDIQKSLRHARMVQVRDVFEIDVDSFGTVLEFCEGIQSIFQNIFFSSML